MTAAVVLMEQRSKRADKTRPVERPTTEFDLGRTPRFNPANNAIGGFRRYLGEAEAERLLSLRAEHTREWAAAGIPGFALADRALAAASYALTQTAQPNQGLFAWTKAAGPRIRSPRDLGLAPYIVSPERAAGEVKTAARYFGAALVGITTLRKEWVFTHLRRKPITFEECSEPAETEERYIIPERCQWVISCAVEMSREAISHAPSAIADAAMNHSYSRAAFLIASLTQFIRGLGYVAIPDLSDILLEVPFAVAAGLGELGRLNRLVTPQYGPRVRLHSVITDFPLALDKPVDFGLQDFCRRCRKCALACPGKALSLEKEPTWETKGAWNNPGKRAWFEDSTRCYSYWQEITTSCGVCLAACPWSKGKKRAKALVVGNGTGGPTWWGTALSPYGL